MLYIARKSFCCIPSLQDGIYCMNMKPVCELKVANKLYWQFTITLFLGMANWPGNSQVTLPVINAWTGLLISSGRSVRRDWGDQFELDWNWLGQVAAWGDQVSRVWRGRQSCGTCCYEGDSSREVLRPKKQYIPICAFVGMEAYILDLMENL